MESKANRTLVKSAPELWELADDIARLEEWTSGLVLAQKPVSIEVTRREPERTLAWRSRPNGEDGQARVTIELLEKGFGTSVSITAYHSGPDPSAAGEALERLLDELGAPERRPFARG
jgi:hypothetical protein